MPARKRIGSRKRPPAGLFFFLILGFPGPALAGTFDGRIALEMEYLGESYFSEQSFTAADLGLPSGSSIIFVDTTRFADDTWLPGQKLDLRWESDPEARSRFRVDSRSAFNNERASQDLDLEARFPAVEGGQWILKGEGSLREDERSLVGHGDWQTRFLGTREVQLGKTLTGGFQGGWQHSRTRGDTLSYLYDYDLLRGRIFFSGGSGWLPQWEGRLEGTLKNVPADEPGGYSEMRLTGSWRKSGGQHGVAADLRTRDYDVDDSVGRDLTSGEVRAYRRLWERGRASFRLEGSVLASDYKGEDDLYFDSAEVDILLMGKLERGSWSLSSGPEVEILTDLSGGDRGYSQWSGRASAGRLVGLGGFLDLNLEAGYRDYRSREAQAIEVSSLSTSLLRSDYWLMDAMILASLPLPGRVNLEVVASSSWEWHTGEAERIQVTFATLGVSRNF